MENNSPGEGGAPPDRPTALEARAALDALDADASQLAERLVTPWWYHLILGVIVAAAIVAPTLPKVSSMTVFVMIIVWIPFLMKAYTSRYQISMTQPAGPRSRRLLLLTLAVLAALMASTVLLKLFSISLWWVVVPAAIGFVVTVVLGRRYDAVLRSEVSHLAGQR